MNERNGVSRPLFAPNPCAEFPAILTLGMVGKCNTYSFTVIMMKNKTDSHCGVGDFSEGYAQSLGPVGRPRVNTLRGTQRKAPFLWLSCDGWARCSGGLDEGRGWRGGVGAVWSVRDWPDFR